MLFVFLQVVASASCSSGWWSSEPEDPSRSLAESDRVALERFIGELREVYSRGDPRAVEAMIANDAEHRVIDLAKKHILPKGPTHIVAHRIIPYEVPDGPIFSLEGVGYELTVEPLGKLVFEVEDVSIGEIEIGFVVGKKDGMFRIAGYQPMK